MFYGPAHHAIWMDGGCHGDTRNQSHENEHNQMTQVEETTAQLCSQGATHVGDGLTDGAHGDASRFGNLIDGQPFVVEHLPHLAFGLRQTLEARLQPLRVFALLNFFLWRYLGDGGAIFVHQLHLRPMSAPHVDADVTGDAQDVSIGEFHPAAHVPCPEPRLLHHLLGLGVRTEEFAAHQHQPRAKPFLYLSKLELICMFLVHKTSLLVVLPI